MALLQTARPRTPALASGLSLAVVLAAAALLAGCGSMLPPPRLSPAEHARVASVGRLGTVAVDPGPERPSTAVFENMLARTDLFTRVVRLDPAAEPADYVAAIEGRCSDRRGGWIPILPILTLGVVPQFGKVQYGFPFSLRDTRSGAVIHVPCEIDGWIGVGWIPAVMAVLPGWTQDDGESGPRFERRLAYSIASRIAPARAPAQ
jgi:hypothetical protein